MNKVDIVKRVFERSALALLHQRRGVFVSRFFFVTSLIQLEFGRKHGSLLDAVMMRVLAPPQQAVPRAGIVGEVPRMFAFFGFEVAGAFEVSFAGCAEGCRSHFWCAVDHHDRSLR